MAYATLRATLAITLLSIAVHDGLACSMFPGDPPPIVQARFNYPPSTAQSPIHLPANAAGVIFLTRKSMPEASFRITEAASGRRLAVRLAALRALKVEKPKRLAPLDWTEGVTALRVGPAAGFTPGTAYKIEAAGDSVNVVIDRTRVDLARQKVHLAKAGAPNREYFFYQGDCPTQDSSGEAVYQTTVQRMPAALVPYLARLYSIVHAPVPRGNAAFDAQPFIGNYLSAAIQFGPFHPMQTELLHKVDTDDELRPVGRQQVVTHYAFFEVDDVWHRTNVLDLTPAPGTIARKDTLDFLREALRSKDLKRLRTQLDATPVRQTSLSPAFQRQMRIPPSRDVDTKKAWSVTETLADWRYQRRHRSLTRTLVQLARHPDAGIRASALGAMGRLMENADPDPLASGKVMKALQAARVDPAPAPRRAASEALALIAASAARPN